MANGKGKQIAHFKNIFLRGFGTSAGGAEGWQGQGFRVASPPRAIFFPNSSPHAFFQFEPGIRNAFFSRLATPTIFFPGVPKKKPNLKNPFIDPTTWQMTSLPFSAKFQAKK